MRWPVIAAIERVGYLAGGAPLEADGVPDGLAAAMDQLARAAGTTAASEPIDLPQLPRTPNIERELRHLAALLGEPR